MGLRPKARVYVLVRIVCTSCVCMSVGESRVRVMDRNSGAWGDWYLPCAGRFNEAVFVKL